MGRDKANPVPVLGVNGVARLAHGYAYSHTCALLDTGRVSCWGENEHGERGVGDTAVYQDATAATYADGTVVSLVTSLSVGLTHSCAVVDDGRVWCWGFNEFGQIGDGTQSATATSPAAVIYADGTQLTTAKSVHCGEYQTCTVLVDDTVWCWGKNDKGQLAVGDTDTNALTVKVPNIDGVQSVSLGTMPAHHACALLRNNTLRCWGSNEYGNLGLGDTMERTSPVTVTAIDAVRSAQVGGGYTCAALVDDSFWCWGRNGKFQLGLSSTANVPLPQEIPGIKDLPPPVPKCTCYETKMKRMGFVTQECKAE